MKKSTMKKIGNAILYTFNAIMITLALWAVVSWGEVVVNNMDPTTPNHYSEYNFWAILLDATEDI